MNRGPNDAKIRVLWDLVDFPVPEGRSIRDIVGSVLRREGYTGELSITAYGCETNPYPDEDGFTFVHNSDKYWRLSKILVDAAFWALENPSPNLKPAPSLMVVAKNCDQQTEFVDFLQNLYNLTFQIFLVLPDDCCPEKLGIPKVNLAWYWTSLLEGGKPIPRTELKCLFARVKQSPANIFRRISDA